MWLRRRTGRSGLRRAESRVARRLTGLRRRADDRAKKQALDAGAAQGFWRVDERSATQSARAWTRDGADRIGVRRRRVHGRAQAEAASRARSRREVREIGRAHV